MIILRALVTYTKPTRLYNQHNPLKLYVRVYVQYIGYNALSCNYVCMSSNNRWLSLKPNHVHWSRLVCATVTMRSLVQCTSTRTARHRSGARRDRRPAGRTSFLTQPSSAHISLNLLVPLPCSHVVTVYVRKACDFLALFVH